MKRKKNLPANPEAVAHSIVCSQCASKLKTIQQDFSFTVMVDRESILLYASDMLRITVDDNYCEFETLMPLIFSRLR